LVKWQNIECGEANGRGFLKGIHNPHKIDAKKCSFKITNKKNSAWEYGI
jgi:hypothetical protein